MGTLSYSMRSPPLACRERYSEYGLYLSLIHFARSWLPPLGFDGIGLHRGLPKIMQSSQQIRRSQTQW